MTYRSMGCALGVLVFWLLQAGSIAYSAPLRSEEHTSELQSQSNLVCRLLLEKKNNILETPNAKPPEISRVFLDLNNPKRLVADPSTSHSIKALHDDAHVVHTDLIEADRFICY